MGRLIENRRMLPKIFLHIYRILARKSGGIHKIHSTEVTTKWHKKFSL